MNLTESIITEVYDSLPYGRVASIIEQHHSIKVTDTLIENYLRAASQRRFTFDSVVFDVRKLNKFDHNLAEGKLEFILEDGSTILISENLYFEMKRILEDNQDALNYLTESKDNFLKILEIINKNKGK